MMQEVTAYRCSDNSIHLDENKAKAYEEDLLGQELDGLLRLFELDITRNQEFRAILGVMKKRTELLKSVNLIINILESNDDN